MAEIYKSSTFWRGKFHQKNLTDTTLLPPRCDGVIKRSEKVLDKNKQRGFVLIASVLVVSLLILLAVYVTNFTITELKISSSQATALQTYYLAESGVAEAIWRLKNDPNWKNNFETNPAWSFTYTKNPALYPNGSYQIQIQNTGLARGEITATGFLNLGGASAKRVIKTMVYKALGDGPIGDNGEFGDGNIIIYDTVLNVYNGGLHANGNVIVDGESTVTIAGDLKATGNINILWKSIVIASSTQPGVAPMTMPSVSFNTPGDPNSYRARANVIYSESAFKNLMWNNQNLTLNGPITYVDGDIEIKGNQNLTINGALVASEDIEAGEKTSNCCWGIRCGTSNVTINKTSDTAPAGLLAKGKIEFESCLGNFNANGLIYANDQIEMVSLPSAFNVTGAVISRKLTLTSLWQGANITREPNVVVYSLGDPTFAPVVTVEHWEEEY
ncbi:hypothetical protein HZA71_00370 [Candidatus Falkowbacteria bacterium]|nr:hypothetical protein [Candidatus Falkowbacteria bacterium]